MIDPQRDAGLEYSGERPLVLLFYDGYDRKALPGLLGAARSRAHRLLRTTKRMLCGQQLYTGHYTAFLALVRSLRTIGCDVRINDFSAARKRPHYPIGIGGTLWASRRVALANPILFGPGDAGQPPEAETLAREPTVQAIIQPSHWACAMLAPACGAKMFRWFAGIDMAQWPDLSAHPKRYDFLIYDKLYWQRDARYDAVLGRMLRHLEARGLTYITLRYGHHHQRAYRAALAQSRALLFVCEQETQGIAYQEALSSGVPVLAWNEGVIRDPDLLRVAPAGLTVSTTPYFDATCGLTFTLDQFETTCDAFLAARERFAPRRYIEQHLSLAIAGARYLAEYQRIAQGGITPRGDDIPA